tara:strand:- start:200 stop:391 length:192 start_codon:yes stop_codon:yes gene_type:complete
MRSLGTMVALVVGAYVAGYNGITHVEVMEYAGIVMDYSERAVSYADRIIDAVEDTNMGERASL